MNEDGCRDGSLLLRLAEGKSTEGLPFSSRVATANFVHTRHSSGRNRSSQGHRERLPYAQSPCGSFEETPCTVSDIETSDLSFAQFQLKPPRTTQATVVRSQECQLCRLSIYTSLALLRPKITALTQSTCSSVASPYSSQNESVMPSQNIHLSQFCDPENASDPEL